MGPKHPGLGMKGTELWKELWHEVKEDVDNVYKGKTSWNADRHLPMMRLGYLEEACIYPHFSDVCYIMKM